MRKGSHVRGEETEGVLGPIRLVSSGENHSFYPEMGAVEKVMAPHSSTLAWKIPWTEEPGRLQSRGSRRVRHD